MPLDLKLPGVQGRNRLYESVKRELDLGETTLRHAPVIGYEGNIIAPPVKAETFLDQMNVPINGGVEQKTGLFDDSTITINGVPISLSGYKGTDSANNQNGGDETNGNGGQLNPFNPMGSNETIMGDMGQFSQNMTQAAVNLGQSIGQMKAWNAGGDDVSRSDRNLNRTKAIGAGLTLAGGAVSAGFDLFRQGAAASATLQRNAWLDRENKKKLANARQGQVVAAAAGGIISGNDGGIVPVVGPSGEFIAPKKGGGNVVAEKGEVASLPGDNLTKEFFGDSHEEGGTPTTVPNGTAILSDRRKLTDKQAADIRERYGIKVSSKDTYADAAKKYKDRIGLNKALDEMAILEEKLKKNTKDVKDKNTARLNSSIISDHMTEVQNTIDELSVKDKDFFDVLFNYQESEKRDQLRQYYFSEGGAVDRKMFDESRKKYNLTEEEAIEYFLDRAMKFDDGGRYLEFVPIYNSRRTENETYGNNGYQALINGTYGRVSEWGASAIAEMARLHPELTRGANKVINIDANGNASWVNPSNSVGNAKAIENVVNRTYSGLRALESMIPNFKEDARNFLIYDFSEGTEQGPNPKSGSGYAHNERTAEGRLGEYHMTRSAAGLRVVTPEQLKALNERGIRNFSDVIADPNKAKEVLNKDDYERLVSLKSVKGAEGLDFVLMDYKPMLADLIEAKKVIMDPKKPIAEKLDPLKDPNPVVNKPKDEEPRKIGRTTEAIPGLFGAIGWGSPELQPSAMDPNYLNQVRYMRAEPVLRSADEVVAGVNAGTNAQIRALGDVADPQRYAAIAMAGANRDEAIGKAISEIDYFNATQRNRADEINEGRFMQTEQINAALRDQYEQRVLQDRAANEDAWFKYFQNVRDRQLAEDEVRIKAQILRNIYPNVDTQGRYVNGDPLSSSRLQQVENIRKQYEDDDKKKRTSKKGGK